jgi:hypothetical protein
MSNNETDMLVLIAVDDLRFAIPQQQIITLESANDLDDSNCIEGAVGWTETESGKFPAYPLNGKMQLTQQVKTRFISVVLTTQIATYALLVDEVRFLEAQQIDWEEIPRTMKTSASPVKRVAVFENMLTCLTDAEDLFNYVIQARENNRAA